VWHSCNFTNFFAGAEPQLVSGAEQKAEADGNMIYLSHFSMSRLEGDSDWSNLG